MSRSINAAVILGFAATMTFCDPSLAQLRSRARDLSGVMVDLNDGAAFDINSAVRSEEGIELIIHRLTKGRYQKPDDADTSYKKRAEDALNAKISWGAYHLLWFSVDGHDNGAEQATGFLRAIQDRCIGNQKVLLAVDWEQVNCVKRGQTQRVACGTPDPQYLISFIKTIKSKTGKNPVVYTSHRTLSTFSDDIKRNPGWTELLTSAPLWFAQPERKFTVEGTQRLGFYFPAEKDFAPWRDFTFWQFATSESMGPTPTRRTSLTIRRHRSDLNWFDGSRENFHDFYNKNAITCNSPVSP